METKDLETEVIKWREERAAHLRDDERSWLNLAGLFWLKPGENTFGSDPKCNFVLPPSAPKKAGVFRYNYSSVTVSFEPGVQATCNGGPVPTEALRDDQDEKPDFLRMGRMILVVIIRGSSTLVRLWDVDNPMRKEFSGLNFYPYKPEYRITARYDGYAPFKVVRQEDIIGEVSDRKMIGYVTFEWEGKSYRLDAEDGGEGGLFIAIRDLTSAKTTYAGGRYLFTERPENGQVVIDFNRAHNMPCGYTLFATCGLPIPGNRLPIAIEAGEKKYRDDH